MFLILSKNDTRCSYEIVLIKKSAYTRCLISLFNHIIVGLFDLSPYILLHIHRQIILYFDFLKANRPFGAKLQYPTFFKLFRRSKKLFYFFAPVLGTWRLYHEKNKARWIVWYYNDSIKAFISIFFLNFWYIQENGTTFEAVHIPVCDNTGILSGNYLFSLQYNPIQVYGPYCIIL